MPPPGPEELPTHLPLFPLPGAIMFPRDRIVIQAFEPRYLRMVNHALAGSRLFGVIQPRDDGTTYTHPIPNDCPLYSVGGAAYIQAFHETDDERYLLQLTGVARFRVTSEALDQGGYRRATVEWDEFKPDFEPADCSALDHPGLLNALRRHAQTHGLKVNWDNLAEDATEMLLHFGIRICQLDNREKQGMLEAEGVVERAQMLLASLAMKEAERSGSGSGSIN